MHKTPLITPGKLISESLDFFSGDTQYQRPEKDKAHAYYLSGARNHFFRLEGFCRLLRDSNDFSYCKEYYKIFKEAEDQLGQYDFQYQLFNEFEKKDVITEPMRGWFSHNLKKSGIALHAFLLKEGWFEKPSPHLIEFRKLLTNMKDIPAEEFKSEIGHALVIQIQKIVKKYKEGKMNPTDIETGIHEMRRRIRWISIYTQISGGLIQLNEESLPSSLSSHYFSSEIMNSSFMKLPSPPAAISPILIPIHAFAALSWMINYLGQLKDTGLKIETLTECLKSTGINSQKEINKVISEAISGYIPLNEISVRAREKLDLFILKEAVLDAITDDIKQSID